MKTISTSESFALGLMKLLGWLLLLALTFVWKGYVLMQLWGWFIEGPFGLRPLSVPLAVGLSVIVGFMTTQLAPRDSGRATSDIIATAVLLPALVLAIGWVASKFL